MPNNNMHLQSKPHKSTVAALMVMTTDLQTGRHVLAQRRMSGQVAKVFTSVRSEYLQVGSALCSYPI